VVLAAWEEVLADNPSARRISMLFIYSREAKPYLLLRRVILTLRRSAILTLRRAILTLTLRGTVVAMT
jgi:hypothetical protein